MNRSFLAVLALAGAAALLAPAPQAQAQSCEFPLCPAGTRYTGGSVGPLGPQGTCKSCSWWGFCSHTINRCPEGSTLNLATGECTHNLCTSGCGGQLPLCEANERYTGSGTRSTGVYGVCQSGPSGPGGYLSHRLAECRTGWTLQTATGQCRKDCLADLTLRDGYLRDATGAFVSSVRAYQPYYVCVQATNVGTVWSPSSQLRGGGLGVPTAPTAYVPSLAVGAYRDVCVRYPTTPAPGVYKVGLTVDFDHRVREANETNNSTTVAVRVVAP